MRGAVAMVFVAMLTAPGPVLAQDFRAAINAAMSRMDSAMMAPGYSGNADADFAAMMIAHHQGAIDMAQVELRFGTDPVLRRLAQGIIVEQKQEIDVMRRALAEVKSRDFQPSTDHKALSSSTPEPR